MRRPRGAAITNRERLWATITWTRAQLRFVQANRPPPYVEQPRDTEFLKTFVPRRAVLIEGMPSAYQNLKHNNDIRRLVVKIYDAEKEVSALSSWRDGAPQGRAAA